MNTMTDIADCRKTLSTAEGDVTIYSLKELEKQGVIKDLSKMPYSIRVLIESLLRQKDGRLITDDESYFLVSNGIQTIRESGFGRENIPAMMAAVVVISLPLIVLFLIFRNKIMEGVSRGGTKG